MKDKKISIIIPNFNGVGNLERNLPKVLEIKNSSVAEIIVVDDDSTDKSLSFLSKNYPQIKVIKNERNRGFAYSCNQGVKQARGDIIVLFNTDVVPEKDVFKFIMPYFRRKHTFAVSFLEKVKTNGKIELHGRGKGVLKKGFFLHLKYQDYKNSGFSLWAVGGAAAFERKKWLKLNGFDEVFAPFYWEDVDLGFRAWLKGYKVYFEPKAVVWHEHKKGSIKAHYSDDFIKTVSLRNQFLFFWKHFLWGKYLIRHLLWLPYHFVSLFFKREWSFFKGFLWALRDFKKLKKIKAKIDKIEARDIFNPK